MGRGASVGERGFARLGLMKSCVLMAGILMAMPALSFIGGGAAATTETSTVLVFAEDAKTMAGFSAAGAAIVVDYGNGYYILESDRTLDEETLSRMGLQSIEDRTTVKLTSSGYVFDTTRGEPEMDAMLRRAYAPSETGVFLVQFIGPARGGWEQEIETQGAEVVSWLDGNLALTRMNGEAHRAVESMDIVEWVGVWHPAYKIPSGALDGSGVELMAARAYPNGDTEAMATAIDGAGATVGRVETADGLVRFCGDAETLRRVACLEDVMTVLPDGIAYPMDSRINEIHSVIHAWNTSMSGLGSTLTGAGEVVHIQDTGFDEGNPSVGHCDFYQGPNGDRVLQFTDRTGQSIPDGYETGLAHGTAVAGVLLGNGYCWETHNGQPTDDYDWRGSEAGVAPEAELVFDGCTFGVSISTSLTYTDEAYLAYGAKTSSNSWGGVIADYGATATGVDTRIDANNDRMLLFCSGNSGPGLETISSESLAKNGFCVGSCQNVRTNRSDADNPNIVDSFSGRGGTGVSGGRIKPDLVVAASSVITTTSRGEWDCFVDYYGIPVPTADMIMYVDEYDYNTKLPGADGRPDYSYYEYDGTSYACASLAGMYLLTREYLREEHSIANANSQLCKALLINGADPLAPGIYDYPSYEQGWGRANLRTALFPDAPRTNQFEEGSFTDTGLWHPSSMNLEVASDEVPLMATLVWVDDDGVNLVRNLDLELRSPGGIVYRGNDYRDGWTRQNGVGTDGVNNVEKVSIPNPEPGIWNVTVVGNAIPTTANFAIVFSADTGPSSPYKPDISSDAATTFQITDNGHVSLVVEVSNFGTQQDTIAIQSVGPFGVTFTPSGPYTLASRESIEVKVRFSSSGLPSSTYTDELIVTSSGGTVRDTLVVRGQVITGKIPSRFPVAVTEAEEKDPAILTFNDGVNDRIIVAYLETTSVGRRVKVMHTTLNPSTKEPRLPWSGPIEVPAATEGEYVNPSDVKITYMPSGAYANRVYISFTAKDLAQFTDSNCYDAGAGYVAYADAPYTTWSNHRACINVRSSGSYGTPRCSFTLCRPVANQVMFVWEHVDYSDPWTLTGINSHMVTSGNGGATWGIPVQVNPNDGNFYFFPSGCVDQNGVAWIFFYWRTPAGNDRDLTVRLYDGTLSPMITVWDTTDNVMFPAAFSTAEGPSGNRVYVATMRDIVAGKFQVYTTYIDGDYSSSVPPPSSTNGWGNTHGPYGRSVCDANFANRQVLNLVQTSDGNTWISYLEKDDYPNDVNIDCVRSDDGFATADTFEVTTDLYPKGHPTVSALLVGSKATLYEAYHASLGSLDDVDYDIYMTIVNSNWKTEDTRGPFAESALSTGGVQMLASALPTRGGAGPITIEVNLLDMEFSSITAAECKETTTLVVDPTTIDWTGAISMALTGNTSAEIASVEVSTAGWRDGEVHRFWVRGCDDTGNWGTSISNYLDVSVGEPMFLRLQTAASPIAGYANLTDEALSNGGSEIVTLIEAGEYKLGAGAWATEVLVADYDISGTWSFETYGNISSYDGQGYLYAKVYNYNGGTPTLLFTTGYDDENVQSFFSPHRFSWKHVAPNLVVPAGDRIFVEYWLHATAGKGDDRTTIVYDFEGVTQATNDHYARQKNTLSWAAVGAPASDGGSGWTEATDPQYALIASDDANRWSVAIPAISYELTMLYEMDIAEDPSAVTEFTLAWNGMTSTFNSPCVLYIWNPTANIWSTALSTTTITTTAEGTAQATIQSDLSSYATAGGVVAWAAYFSTRCGVNTDVATMTVKTGSDSPHFTLLYDYVLYPSGVLLPHAMSSTPVIPVVHDVPYEAGWNLISFAVDTEGGKPLATVFADEWSNIEAIRSFDAEAGRWLMYERGAPNWINTLHTADETKGYWVKFTDAGDGQLAVQGYLPTTTTIQLHEGWNLVGCPDSGSVAASTVLAGTGYDMLQRFDAGSPYFILDMLPAEMMAPGSAYWVHVPADTSYVVTY